MESGTDPTFKASDRFNAKLKIRLDKFRQRCKSWRIYA